MPLGRELITHRAIPSIANLLVPSTGLEVSADPLSCPLSEFWELSRAGIDNSLNLLFRLLGDWHHPVQVLVHEQSYKHLNWKEEEEWTMMLKVKDFLSN